MIVTDKKYSMDNALVEQLDFLKECIGKKWDGVIMGDGVEGSAKSSFFFQIAYYLDPTFNIDKIVFTPDQFVEAVDKAGVGEFILWDEFSLAGLSTDAMTKVQGTILKKMTTIRSKRLYIGLIMSWFFELRKFFAVGRTRFLVHTYTPDGISRGYFKLWGFDSKRKLYFKGKKDYSYNVKYDLRGTFPDTTGWFFDIEAYEKKKQEAIKTIDFDNTRESKFKAQRDTALVALCDYEHQTKVAERVGVTQQLIANLKKQTKKKDIFNGGV